MNVYEVIRRPIVTEKGVTKKESERTLCFEVAVDANKTQIRQAVQVVFGVRVTGVNTVNRPGKRRRTRFGWGKRPDTKRAIVSLAEGDRIDIFGGPVG